MSVLLTKEQQKLFEDARAFAVDYIVPKAAEWEKNKKLPQELVDELIKRGYMGMMSPKEYGGHEMSYLDSLLVIEGIAHGDGGASFFTELMNVISFDSAVHYKPGPAIKPLLKDIVTGKKLTCFCFSEKDAGTDPFRAKTVAVKKDDGYHITGEKTWASNCTDADYLTVFATYGERNMAAFLVDAKSKGVEITEVRERLGGNLISSGTIKFDDVVVPAERLISENAYSLAMHGIDIARLYVSTMAVGFAQRALDITVAYLQERTTFGKPIIKQQYVQFKLAELKAKVEAARWLLYHTASMIDSGEWTLAYAVPRVKYFCPAVAWETTSECAHFFGGVGCEVNKEITRLMGNAAATRIEDGTSEVQLMLLSKDFMPPKK